MAVTKNNLQFYLTGADPFVAGTDTSQSIGGYPVTLFSPTTTLTADATVNSTAISTANAIDPGYILLGGEVIQIDDLNNGTRGSLSTTVQSHASGDPVMALNNSLFNNSFNVNGQQFRCIAVKNANTVNTFYDVSLYIKHNSLTPNTQIALAIEIPKSDYISGSVDSGTIISFVDEDLIGYANNRFADAVITIVNGNNINQKRVIISSDNATGTIVLDSALPFALNAGDVYKISPRPSQRLIKGTDTPSHLSFTNAIDLDNSIDINVGGFRAHGNDLAPNEVVYLWIRRTRSTNAIATPNNRIVISAHYRKV